MNNEKFYSLPLKDALRRLHKDLKDVFGGYTVSETARTLHIQRVPLPLISEKR